MYACVYVYRARDILCQQEFLELESTSSQNLRKCILTFDYLDHNVCRMMVPTKSSLLTNPPAKVGELLQRLKNPRKLPNLIVRPTSSTMSLCVCYCSDYSKKNSNMLLMRIEIMRQPRRSNTLNIHTDTEQIK